MALNDYQKKEILDLVYLAIYLGITLGVMTLAVGFSLGGFERQEIFEKNNFYLPYGIIFFVFFIVSLKVAGLIIFKKKNAAYEGTIVHDPEQTPLGKFSIVKRPLLLIAFSLIIFMSLGWIAATQNTFFSDFPRYEQQFTTGADIFFSVYPASPSETLGALSLISLVGFVLGYLMYKGKLSPTVFFVLFLILGTIVSGTFGYVNHIARYGDSEIAIRNVIMFWSFGGFVTVLTGSVIPFLIMHDVNNFIFKLSKLFGSDIVNFIVGLILGIMVLLFIILYIRSRKKRRRIDQLP